MTGRVVARLLPYTAVVVACIAFAAPGDSFHLYIGTLFVIWALWATSLNLIWGYAGVLSLAQVAFGAIGGYVVAMLVDRPHWNYWLSLLCAVAIAVAVSVVVGFASFRLRHFAFAVMTLTFGLLVLVVFSNWSLSGDNNGIDSTVDMGSIGVGSLRWTLASQSGGLFATSAVMLLVSIALIGVYAGSRVGRATVALREDETLATSVGIPALRYRLYAFAGSAAIAAIAGSLYAASFQYVTPEPQCR
jgi:branched-chain amino acid transport system permease protein